MKISTYFVVVISSMVMLNFFISYLIIKEVRSIENEYEKNQAELTIEKNHLTSDFNQSLIELTSEFRDLNMNCKIMNNNITKLNK